jgi:hypothetical protein
MRVFFGGMIVLNLILIGVAVGEAQTKTPVPQPTPVPETPFQKVQVGDFQYSVDPFFPATLTLTKRVEELSSSNVVSSTVTFQPFFRIGTDMTAQEAFVTHDSEILKGMQVGQSLTCAPQTNVSQP